MMNKLYIGIDIGGTAVKLAIVNDEGLVLNKWEMPTNTSNKGKEIIPEIADFLNNNLKRLNLSKQHFHGIGVGVPGFVDAKSGIVSLAVNLGWKDYNVKSELEKLTGLSVVIDNDANLAALGEMWKGAGQNEENVLCVTVGTGVGGGVILNGDIIHGANGMAGEIGHYTSVLDGHVCGCGKKGCLETISSATGMTRLATEYLNDYPSSLLSMDKEVDGKINTRHIFNALEKGDVLAQKVVDEATYHLGLALANLANSINPSKIIVGGGVSAAGEGLLIPLKEKFEKFVLPRVLEACELKLATLGNDAGVIGCAWLVENKIEKR